MAIEVIIKTKQSGELKMEYAYKLTQGVYENKEAYGIEVERTDILDGEIINVVSDQVKIISYARDKVRGILEKLSTNEVSPIHLIDIIGEDVDKCILDF